MASVNKAIIIGNLGKDPDIRYMPNGDAVANITVATTEHWKDKHTGEKQEKTEWHRVTFYRRQAEVVGEYLDKGSSVYIEGRLETRKWTDKHGADRYTTEIIADKLVMLGSKGGKGEKDARDDRKSKGKSSYSESRAPAKNGTSFDDMDDDIPFAVNESFLPYRDRLSKAYVRARRGKGLHLNRIYRPEF